VPVVASSARKFACGAGSAGLLRDKWNCLLRSTYWNVGTHVLLHF